MNACGVDKACKSNAPTTKLFVITQTGWWSGSGERASNALVTYPRDRNKPPKGGLMSDSLERVKTPLKGSLWEGPRSDQFVGRVMAYQDYDR